MEEERRRTLTVEAKIFIWNFAIFLNKPRGNCIFIEVQIYTNLKDLWFVKDIYKYL